MSQSHKSLLAQPRVTVRQAHMGDEDAIARLAALDGARVPQGPVLVAESEARVLAALPLGSGRPIADPFEPTAALVSLLELRARQLDKSSGRHRGGRLRALLRMRPAQSRA